MTKIFSVSILFILLLSCSNPKIHLPQQEIDRPYWLPPKNWEIGCGVGPYRYLFINYEDSSRKSWMISPSIGLPSVRITEKWDFDFSVLQPRYFIFRDISLADSIIKIVGPTVSIRGGLNGFGYNSINGFISTFELVLESKLPIVNKYWLEPRTIIQYTFMSAHRDNGYYFKILLMNGIQISSSIYLKLAPTLSSSIFQEKHLGSNNYDRITNVGMLDEIGCNISNRYNIYLTINYSFSSLEFSNYHYLNSILGLRYYW